MDGYRRAMYVQVADEEQDVGPGVGPADADVVRAAVVAQGDDAGGVDAVAADAAAPEAEDPYHI